MANSRKSPIRTRARSWPPTPARDMDRGGLRLHYLDEGQGEPVVMVHGNPTWSFYFRRLVEALSPLTGRSFPTTSAAGSPTSPGRFAYTYTLASRVDDLEALLDHLGIDRDVTPCHARLGRDDRHGLRRAPSRADRPASWS